MNNDAKSLNEHLASGGVVIVSTYLTATEYSKRHAGWFFEDDKGNLKVKAGRGSHQLSVRGRLAVGIRTGRYMERKAREWQQQKNRSARDKAIAAAKKAWPKTEIRTRYSPSSPTITEAKERSRQRIAEIEALRLEAESLVGAWNDLLVAAQFVVDVAGDEPSIDKLAMAVDRAKRKKEIAERRVELQGSQAYWSARCELFYPSSSAIGWHLISGDTWEDVVKKIKERTRSA